ncbi:hypothetical protein [Streptomyces sp. TLI_171]|uniref:hypothetical protein n=1 Tax=Streptomyces sp. TLI_171 TaxID=1938859 RepID=UPI000C530888|nr:hypothetical protein [Streptomyces sp. TLI_171]RKE18797.1 hypothetical protein BX266_2092 [Streptomyces sp. TLI_171]
MRVRVAGAVVALVLGFGAVGCDSSGGSGGGSGRQVVALDRAKARLQDLVDGTTAALTPAVRYADDAYRAVPHEGGLSRDDDGTAQLTLRRYVLTKVGPAKQARLLEQVRAYWKGRGYTLHDEASTTDAGAETPDGAGVRVSIGVPGNVTVVADAWVQDPGRTQPFGPAPSPLPTGPDGGLDTMPHVEDPAWS